MSVARPAAAVRFRMGGLVLLIYTSAEARPRRPLLCAWR